MVWMSKPVLMWGQGNKWGKVYMSGGMYKWAVAYLLVQQAYLLVWEYSFEQE